MWSVSIEIIYAATSIDRTQVFGNNIYKLYEYWTACVVHPYSSETRPPHGFGERPAKRATAYMAAMPPGNILYKRASAFRVFLSGGDPPPTAAVEIEATSVEGSISHFNRQPGGGLLQLPCARLYNDHGNSCQLKRVSFNVPIRSLCRTLIYTHAHTCTRTVNDARNLTPINLRVHDVPNVTSDRVPKSVPRAYNTAVR